MRRERVVHAILAAGAVALAYNGVVFTRALSPTRLEGGPPSDEVLEEGSAEEIGAPAPLGAISDAEIAVWLETLPAAHRNPFLTAAEAGAEREPELAGRSGLPVPALHGVLFGPTRRVAWIDQAPVAEGDRVGPFRVEHIQSDAVVLRRGAERLELHVGANVREGVPEVWLEGHDGASGGEHTLPETAAQAEGEEGER